MSNHWFIGFTVCQGVFFGSIPFQTACTGDLKTRFFLGKCIECFLSTLRNEQGVFDQLI